jgi:hypothetical protein
MRMQPGSTTWLFEEIMRDVTKALAESPTVVGNEAGGRAVVTYGMDALTNTMSDPAAVEELKVMLNNRGKFRGKNDPKRFSGGFEFRPIAGDPNNWMVTIHADKAYAESFKSYKDQPGAISGKSISIKVPKSIATNTLYSSNQRTTATQQLYDMNQPIKHSNSAGEFTITKTAYGPEMTYNLKVFDPRTGQFRYDTEKVLISENKDVESARRRGLQIINELEAYNRTVMDKMRSTSGIKDPDVFLQELLTNPQ